MSRRNRGKKCVCVCVCVDLIVNHMQCCGENVDRRRSVPRVRVPSLRRKTQGHKINNQRAAVRLRGNLREELPLVGPGGGGGGVWA